MEAIADPTHPEHQDRLDWLGIDDPSEIDPARFNPDEVTARLAVLR